MTSWAAVAKTWILMQLLLLCRTLHVGDRATSGVSRFLPPKLDIDTAYIDIPANSTLRITCYGRYPLAWSLPPLGDNVSLRSSIYDEEVNGIRPFKSVFELNTTDVMDLGRYICYYNGTTDLTNSGNATSVYVFVNDDYYLFQPEKQMDQLVFVTVRHGEMSVVPCLPTHSGARVQLWKDDGLGEDEMEEVMLAPHDVEFDPMRGFVIYYPHSYYSGHFICNGSVPGRVYNDSTMAVVFVYLPPVDIAPNVLISKENNFHPVLNDSFTLNCTVTVEAGIMFIMTWDYPNKNSSRIEVTKPIRNDKPFGQDHFMLSVVTSQLTVRDVQRSDEGLYTCSCKDHGGKTHNHSVFVSVYESEQLAHVNLTTDLDTSDSLVFPEGGTFKMVVTVEAHPSFAETSFWWLKDGAMLYHGGELRLSYREPRAVLEKSNARFDDSGEYTLFARIHNVTSKITFNVSISSKPTVTVVNNTELYAHGSNYTLVCTVKGSQPLRAWWEWRECVDPRACDDQGPGRVFKRLAADSSHRNAGAPPGHLVRSTEGLRHRNLTLMLRAQQSGLYRCVAANSLGTGLGVARFYVTDARNGFEVIASDVIPVDQDRVMLSCLASQFKYEGLTWKWKPRGSSQLVSLIPNGNLDVKMSSTAFSNNLTLHFNHISKNQSGEYQCFGSIRGGGVQRHIGFIKVDVRGTAPYMRPPEFNKTNLRNDVLSDVSYLDLQCTATGLPEPSISWLKDGKPLNMSGIDRLDEGRWLVKRKVTPQDSGFYQCRAENRAGAIYANTTINVASGIPAPAMNTTHIVLISVVFVIAIICFLIVLVYCKKYRAHMKEEKEMELLNKTLFDKGQVDMFNPDLPLCEQVELLPYDQRWEFPKDRLKLGRTLGQGAFGRVVKAEAIGLGDQGQPLTVAVKMLKERADMSQRKALMAELKILIHLGRHLNIVNIIGAVTKNVAKGELMVIVEYCKFGNLRHYLLRHRARFVNQLNPLTGKLDPDMCHSPTSPASTSPGFRFAISNPVYCQQRLQQNTPTLKYADLAMSATPTSNGNEFSFSVSDTTDGFPQESGNNTTLMSGSSLRDHGDMRDAALTTRDLLCFAFQCARGMEYLASRKLIHRDLAARNVLLGEGNVVKICDFGLAKDCYKYSNYIKKGDGLLPVKWTAIESIMDRVFTTKSDVWSYGVLLWEIFSLGGNPYPGVAIDESFYKRLKNGYRMEKPDYAPDDVYEIMQSCWQGEPKERPDFSTLVTRVGDLLEAGVRNYYMALNDPYANVNLLLKNNNDYLTMGNKLDPDYLDMKSDDENYINTSRTAAQPSSEPHYAKMAATANVDNGSATLGDSMEMTPMIGSAKDVDTSARGVAQGYMNVGKGPTLQLRLPQGKRRDVPPPLLPPSGGSLGDARASDDVSEICATPPPAYNLVVSVDGSGGIEV
ncbi:vascular endothelial growth factor receptor 1 isoform X2 [Rhipicephalus microplus]|uniref:vascular endothelial growth factor receptor 1 isoform X2 n=1 Tax=Rhipicephalus microplus TaxID=6941 RepID=UPI003F6CB28F